MLDDPDPSLEVAPEAVRRQLSRKASYLAKSEPHRRPVVAADAGGPSRQAIGGKKEKREGRGLGFWGEGDEIDREKERRREVRGGRRRSFKWVEGVVRGGSMEKKGRGKEKGKGVVVGGKLLIGKEGECGVCGRVYEVRRGDRRRVRSYCGQRCREVGKEEERSWGSGY